MRDLGGDRRLVVVSLPAAHRAGSEAARRDLDRLLWEGLQCFDGRSATCSRRCTTRSAARVVLSSLAP